MKKLLILVLAFFSSPAFAGRTSLGAQYGLPQGYTEQLGQAACSPGAPYSQCAFFPGRIVGWNGTITVKQDNIEILAVISCGSGEAIWRGEMFKGTYVIVSPGMVPNDIVGPCWIEFEAINNSWVIDPGSAWEIQFVIFYQ